MSETSHHLWGQTRLVQTSSMMVPQTKRPTKLVLYHPWCCCHVICYPGQWNTWQSQGLTVAWWVTNRDQAPSHNICTHGKSQIAKSVENTKETLVTKIWLLMVGGRGTVFDWVSSEPWQKMVSRLIVSMSFSLFSVISILAMLGVH